jgi:MoaA/NifB/PqqE/SkfB family radical SAM enzyme
MSTEPERPWGSNFSPEEIAETRARKGLLSMELELSRECNLRCVYCYASSGKKLHNELTREEIASALDQAIALGARRIIVIGGGEPLLYPGVMDIMRKLRERGIIVDLFTNGTLITPEVARELFAMGVSPVVKLNSMREQVQDALAAVPGTFRAIQEGLRNLLAAGYPSADAPLGVETIICRQNIDELPGMWVWARERGIVPYFEMITFQGRAKRQLDLNVSSEELRRVFFELSRIDREQFGFVWEPHPPIAALSCNRHEYSCTLNAQGYIQPCVGVDMFIGNIRHAPLAEILATAPVMATMRGLRGHIKGACSSCDQSQECYGCRGLAYHVTGDFLEADPLCWLNPRRII